ncbi:SipW-dependent-type signal peptide-containing protein [Microbacterium luteolum]|nr:SipW-dependent-type signal peptide-containing protein [Microbacterium luteolum]
MGVHRDLDTELIMQERVTSVGMTPRRWRLRRARAVLACGLVLGIGVSSTLAAWNDSEYGGATFTAGTFNIQGATDGATFSQHATAPAAATLSFAVPAVASAMSPGDAVYALFSVKTVNPSMAGAVQLRANASNNAGLGAYLTYSVRTISQTTCNAANFAAGTALAGLAAGSPLTVGSTSTQALSANGANQVNYCFEVTLPAGTPTAAQGTTLTAAWEFTATSG